MLSSEGSELEPLGAAPLGVRLTSEVLGVQLELVVAVEARHVLRTKMPLTPVVGFARRFVELEAKATSWPVCVAAGPAVESVGIVPEQVAPQIPLSAWLPSRARSTSIGSPNKFVGFTANVTIFDVPPPGAGLTTCTWLTPADARSPAVSKAAKLVEFTKVVVRAAPLIVTVELRTKPTPVNAIVAAALPALAEAGLNEVRLGVWFFTDSGKLLDDPPFGAGFTTAISNVPDVLRSAPNIEVCSEVELMKVVE